MPTIPEATAALANELAQLKAINVDDYAPDALAVAVGWQVDRLSRAAWNLTWACRQDDQSWHR